jgi:hypothetical protein
MMAILLACPSGEEPPEAMRSEANPPEANPAGSGRQNPEANKPLKG